MATPPSGVLRARCRPQHPSAAGQPGSGRRPRQLHVGGEHRRLPLVRRRGRRPAPDRPGQGGRTGQGDTDRGAVHAPHRRHALPVVRHHDRRVDPQPRRHQLLAGDHSGAGQLLLPLRCRQRVVRLRPRRGAPGAARAEGAGVQPARSDGLLDLLRQPGPEARLQHQPRHPREPADRPDVRRLLRRPGARVVPQRRALQRPTDRHVHGDGDASDAGRRVVAHLAGAAAQAVRHRPRLLVAGAACAARRMDADRRPAVAQDVQRLGGPLHLPGHGSDVHPDLRWRHVRGADGQRGRAGDDLGADQLRSRRCPDRRRADQVRHPAAARPGLGHVPVELRR